MWQGPTKYDFRVRGLISDRFWSSSAGFQVLMVLSRQNILIHQGESIGEDNDAWLLTKLDNMLPGSEPTPNLASDNQPCPGSISAGSLPLELLSSESDSPWPKVSDKTVTTWNEFRNPCQNRDWNPKSSTFQQTHLPANRYGRRITLEQRW